MAKKVSDQRTKPAKPKKVTAAMIMMDRIRQKYAERRERLNRLFATICAYKSELELPSNSHSYIIELLEEIKVIIEFEEAQKRSHNSKLL